MARFLMAQSHYATISLFHRRGIPSSAPPGTPGAAIAIRPILIDCIPLQGQEVAQDANPSSGLEIVPWHSCLHAIALQSGRILCKPCVKLLWLLDKNTKHCKCQSYGRRYCSHPRRWNRKPNVFWPSCI
jgi:hypothetical protein